MPASKPVDWAAVGDLVYEILAESLARRRVLDAEARKRGISFEQAVVAAVRARVEGRGG